MTLTIEADKGYTLYYAKIAKFLPQKEEKVTPPLVLGGTDQAILEARKGSDDDGTKVQFVGFPEGQGGFAGNHRVVAGTTHRTANLFPSAPGFIVKGR